MKFIPKNIWFYLGLIFISILILISVFANLSYPLLWGDESETTVFAQRIIQYGFPKVHDGRNVVNLTMIPEKGIGIKESIDAWIHLPWGQYYFAVPGVWVAEGIKDIYLKTAVVRFPFALVGLMGVLVYAFLISLFLKKGDSGPILIYLFFILLSVSLVLHLREVRIYSLIIFLSSLITYFYCRWHFLKNITIGKYALWQTVLLLFMINLSPPVFLSFVLILGFFPLFENLILNFFRQKNEAYDPKELRPLGLSLLLGLPFLLFYETFYVSSVFSKYLPINIFLYKEHLLRIVTFFWRYDYLALAVVSKGFLFAVLYLKKKKGLVIDDSLLTAFRVSLFCLFTLTVFSFVISRMPYLLDRYYINLVPVFIFGLVLDLYLIFKLSSIEGNSSYPYYYLLLFVFIASSFGKIGIWSGHIYEISHRYKGPSDTVIEYIRGHFKNPRNLIVETNLEQTTLVYYLGSFVLREPGINLEKIEPDIIVPRNYIDSADYQPVVDGFLKRNKYRKVYLDVMDYPVNNIPEFSLMPRHLFKTNYAKNIEDGLLLYLNEKTIDSNQFIR